MDPMTQYEQNNIIFNDPDPNVDKIDNVRSKSKRRAIMDLFVSSWISSTVLITNTKNKINGKYLH